MATTSATDSRWYGNLADYVGTDMDKKNKTKGNATLDKNAFLNILVAQLQNQDPLSPMDNAEMVNQLTQFTTIEQLQQQTAATMQNQAYAMIGKYATGQLRSPTGTLSDSYVYGRVESVFKQNGEVWLSVGGQNVRLDDILEVYDLTSISGNSDAISNAAAVIGKYITAEVPIVDEKGKTIGTEKVEGYAESIIVKDGVVFVRVGDRNIGFSLITEILAQAPEPKQEPSDLEKANAAVGKYVTAQIPIVDEDGNVTGYETVTGLAESVAVKDDIVYVLIGDREVAFSLITDISENAPEEEPGAGDITPPTDVDPEPEF